MVTARTLGDNLSVDIAANAGYALVEGDSISAQGLYVVPPHSAVINEAITPGDATFPRVDQVILEVRDNVHDASAGNEARVRVLAGTPTSGATLTNRTGAAPLPSNAIRLADVLVPANDTSISNSQIRDRRPWARGARYQYVKSGSSYTTAAGSFTAIDATNLSPRMEISTGLVGVRLAGRASLSVAGTIIYGLSIDGVAAVARLDARYDSGVANFPPSWLPISVAPGSHTIAIHWFTTGGSTATLDGITASDRFIFEFYEEMRNTGANNATTSG